MESFTWDTNELPKNKTRNMGLLRW